MKFGRITLGALITASLACIPLLFTTGTLTLNCEAIVAAQVNCEVSQSHWLGFRTTGQPQTIERVKAITSCSVDNDSNIYSPGFILKITGQGNAQLLQYNTFAAHGAAVQTAELFLTQVRDGEAEKTFSMTVDDRRIVVFYWLGGFAFIFLVFSLAEYLAGYFYQRSLSKD
ncbi:MAG: hypothetical protein AAGG53_00140 [Cyanobacteria bacterium P01_H01_bin.152]